MLAAAMACVLQGCVRKRTSGPLRIAYVPITHTLPLFAMNELAEGGENGSGVELVKFGSWTELTDALNSGCVDGAILLAEIAVKARERGVPLKAVALGHHDGNVVVARPDITAAGQLRGQTVAIPHRLSSHHLLLGMLLRQSGLALADVVVTELPPPEMPAALAEGRIAAYIVAEPFGAKAVVQGAGHVLCGSPQLWPHSVCCTLVLREEVATGRRQEAGALARGYRLAADSLARSPEWQLKVAGKYLTAPNEVLQQSLQWIDFADLGMRPADYDTLVCWMQRLHLCRRAPAFGEMADTALWTGARQ